MPIPVIAWIALGAFATYVATRSEVRRAAARAKKKLALPEGLSRLPRPDYAVEIPQTIEDHSAVDILICEAFINQVQRGDEYLYVLKELYPDFEWPAIYADHPTTQQLQGIVRFRVDQAYAVIPSDPHSSKAKFCAEVPKPGTFDPFGP